MRPMGANDLALLKCEHCQSLVWIDELPIVYDPREPDSSGHDNNFSEAKVETCVKRWSVWAFVFYRSSYSGSHERCLIVF